MDKERIVNLTNHDITMLFCEKLSSDECEGRKEGGNFSQKCRECPYENKGKIEEIEPFGVVMEATSKEEFFKKEKKTIYVTTNFEPNKKSKKDLLELEDECFDLGINPIFIGSIIAAQAFPEKVVAMIPVPGYERVPIDEKLVRSDKFAIFPKEGQHE